MEAAVQAKESAVAPGQKQPLADDPVHYASPEVSAIGRDQYREQDLITSPSKRRKLSYANVENSIFDLGATDISQYLPKRSVLIEVAEFFCVSFHHWIPFIHKQRLQERVRRGDHSPSFDLVLHALVAVAFGHINSDLLSLDTDALLQQARISRLIVESQATRVLSIEGLQAIILIVFDDVSLVTILKECLLTSNS